MRYALIALSILLGATTPAVAQVSVTVSIPGVSIGIHQPVYPELVQIPGYPVYYAPHVRANYFFYDGLYWVYQDDRWYASTWYDGPWDLVEPDDVPLFVLRVPVRYYVAPPVYFSGWVVTAPPLWHVYWGPRWTRYHHGWDHWDRRVVYAPAPLPVYQRHYHGDRYPRREYQRVIRQEHYHYQSRDRIVRRHDQQQRPQVHAQPHKGPAQHGPAQHSPDTRREHRSQRDSEPAQRPQRDREEVQRSQRDREDMRRSEPQQRAQQQLQPQRQEPPRQVHAPVQPLPVQSSPVLQAPQSRPDTPRPQQASREREQMQRVEPQQLLPQQRAAIQAQRAQPQPQRAQPQPQQAAEQRAPRPQQAQGPQGRGEASQPRAGAEQRQGPRPDRGQERGRDRGQGRG